MAKTAPWEMASNTSRTVMVSNSLASAQPPLRPPVDVTMPAERSAAMVRRTTTSLVCSIWARVAEVVMPPRKDMWISTCSKRARRVSYVMEALYRNFVCYGIIVRPILAVSHHHD
ncbi:hypothetical protein D3C71_1370560 [compost metagenome]